MCRAGSLQTLVFPLPSCVVRLHHDSDVLECRKHVMLAVKRDNPWSKIESFMSLAANENDTCVLVACCDVVILLDCSSSGTRR